MTGPETFSCTIFTFATFIHLSFSQYTAILLSSRKEVAEADLIKSRVCRNDEVSHSHVFCEFVAFLVDIGRSVLLTADCERTTDLFCFTS